MIEIHHGPEPEELKKFRQDYIKERGAVDSSAWDSYGKSPCDGKNALIERLYALQDGLCIYCEREISKNTLDSKQVSTKSDSRNRQVEHILSRDEHGEHTLTYENMALSCMRAEGQKNKDLRKAEDMPNEYCGKLDSCGEAKGSHSIPWDFVKNNSTYMELSDDGTYIPKNDDYKERVALYVDQYLNLNKPSLVSFRKERIKELNDARKAMNGDSEGFQQFLEAQLSKGPFRFSLKRVFGIG